VSPQNSAVQDLAAAKELAAVVLPTDANPSRCLFNALCNVNVIEELDMNVEQVKGFADALETHFEVLSSCSAATKRTILAFLQHFTMHLALDGIGNPGESVDKPFCRMVQAPMDLSFWKTPNTAGRWEPEPDGKVRSALDRVDAELKRRLESEAPWRIAGALQSLNAFLGANQSTALSPEEERLFSKVFGVSMPAASAILFGSNKDAGNQVRPFLLKDLRISEEHGDLLIVLAKGDVTNVKDVADLLDEHNIVGAEAVAALSGLHAPSMDVSIDAICSLLDLPKGGQTVLQALYSPVAAITKLTTSIRVKRGLIALAQLAEYRQRGQYKTVVQALQFNEKLRVSFEANAELWKVLMVPSAASTGLSELELCIIQSLSMLLSVTAADGLLCISEGDPLDCLFMFKTSRLDMAIYDARHWYLAGELEGESTWEKPLVFLIDGMDISLGQLMAVHALQGCLKAIPEKDKSARAYKMLSERVIAPVKRILAGSESDAGSTGASKAHSQFVWAYELLMTSQELGMRTEELRQSQDSRSGDQVKQVVDKLIALLIKPYDIVEQATTQSPLSANFNKVLPSCDSQDRARPSVAYSCQ
jgi:hypothetical protein